MPTVGIDSVLEMVRKRRRIELANRCPNTCGCGFVRADLGGPFSILEHDITDRTIADRDNSYEPHQAREQNSSESVPNESECTSFLPKHCGKESAHNEEQMHSESMHPRLKDVHPFVRSRVLREPSEAER